ncbi:hypothetical protein ABZV91_13175 [Nocardia sp. NPDC004568]|uniref:hypothetical protein n=1 Tax=Nocardia sp. NPDC004568 TaxID=3154551 RepID=UPI0033A771EC
MVVYILVTAFPVLALGSYLAEQVEGWLGYLLASLILEFWLAGIVGAVLLPGQREDRNEKRKQAEQDEQERELLDRIQRERDENPHNVAVRRRWEEMHPGQKFPW